MIEVLLDSDTLSLFLRSQPSVRARAYEYLAFHDGFTFSVITHFEILRGLKVKDATAQIKKFGEICEVSNEIELSPEVIRIATDIYANLHNLGKIIGDADILIAATALHLDFPVVTNNEKHFARIPGLEVINWNK